MTCTWSSATAVNSPGRPNVTISRLHEAYHQQGFRDDRADIGPRNVSVISADLCSRQGSLSVSSFLSDTGIKKCSNQLISRHAVFTFPKYARNNDDDRDPWWCAISGSPAAPRKLAPLLPIQFSMSNLANTNLVGSSRAQVPPQQGTRSRHLAPARCTTHLGSH